MESSGELSSKPSTDEGTSQSSEEGSNGDISIKPNLDNIKDSKDMAPKDEKPKGSAKRKFRAAVAASSSPSSSVKRKQAKPKKKLKGDSAGGGGSTTKVDVNKLIKEPENIFTDLEAMESIELLTEHLARKASEPEGKEVIVGELVSGFSKSLSVYYCTECKYVFPEGKHYKEHKKAGQCIFVCYSCGETFTFKIYSSFLKHMKSHNPGNEGTSVAAFMDTSLLDDDLPMELNQPVPKNTLRVNMCVAEKFRKYLKMKKIEDNFETFDAETLNKHLIGFYPQVKTKDGEMFKVHSFENIRYSLARYLKSAPCSSPHDIINDEAFKEANVSFNKVLEVVKKMMKGAPERHQTFEPIDLLALYESEHLDPSTAVGLLNRIQMNVRLYFCRQPRDFIEKMTKDTFTVDVFPNGKKCIVRANEPINEYMPEDREDPRNCPVKNFETYISKIHPACDKLWQVPKEPFRRSDKTWYQNKAMGRDSLAKYMPKLREKILFSKVYTNHSIRLTGCAFYNRMKLTPEQILAATKMKCSKVQYNQELSE